MFNAKIYILIDPRDNKLRYVGKTMRTPDARLKSLLCGKNNPLVAEWLLELKSLGLKPSIATFWNEYEHRSEWDRDEAKLIYFLTLYGHILFNIATARLGYRDGKFYCDWVYPGRCVIN